MSETQYQNALPKGYLLHRQYEIAGVLGKGGFGITYLAVDRENGRNVAVKELFPWKSVMRDLETTKVGPIPGQEEFFAHLKKRFLEEAQILCGFQDIPNVVKIFHLFEENGTAYYVMEYLEGMDLKKVLKQQGTFAWEQLSGIVRMILEALHGLHSRNMIHRDISPDNIYITNQGRAVLIDFGSVRNSSNAAFTTFLKDNFAPFEQYQENGKQGAWTDIYSFSVTLYYALSKVLPPRATDRMRQDAVQPLGQLCPEIPTHVSAAIMKGMAVHQIHRFQSIQEYAKALFPGEQIIRTATQPQNNWSQQKTSHGNACTNGNSQERWTPHGSHTTGQGSTTFNENSGGWKFPELGLGKKLKEMLDPKRFLFLEEEEQRDTTGNSFSGQQIQGSFTGRLSCVHGYYQGRSWDLHAGVMTTLGRENCSILYPAKTPGISRLQCTFLLDRQGRLYVRDENSTYGTFLNGNRLQPGQWYQLGQGMVLGFAQERYQAEVRRF